MKRTALILGAAILLVTGLLVTTNAYAANLLTNPGFESGSLSGWSCTGTGSGVVTTPVHSGSYALNGNATASDTAQCTQTVTVQPSTAYTLTGWVRGSYVYLGVTGGASTWTSGTGYTKLTVPFTTAAGQTSVQVYLHGWYGTGAYNADDISLDGPGGQPSPTTASPTRSPSASPSPSKSPSASPSKSPSTSPSTSQPPVTGLPKHALIGYLHASFANGSGYVRMADVPAAWDIINLSFGEPTSVTSGDIRFNRCSAAECAGVESDAEFLAAIKAKQAQGKKVLISIGGQNGQVQLTTAAARDAFVSSVSAIIDRWGLDGLDIDFEGHSLYLNPGDSDFRNPTTPVVVNLIAALKSLKAKYGTRFVLTMAPETFFVQLGYQFYGGTSAGDNRAGSYLPVIHALRDSLTVLHVQDYNSGPITGLDNQYHQMGGADFHIAMTDMLKAGFPVANTGQTFPGLRADQIAFGVPAAVSAGNGYVAPAVVQAAVNCLVKGSGCGSYTLRGGTSPDFRGLMTWSINWDRYYNWEFMNTQEPFLNALP
ncbi:carbohydrate binding domain-containing protein [Dactylosporangium aurantiacum]|uniref:chitinase n=1 Tax=Dactylosporangium aurantiacum TaxID=35754 RepID=A0A9Q9I9Q7_9ACTN|nr:glycosyl hydrolase family 18 protein [Dactylosporangium aurantiacum]MDG6106504.1 glycosyl hydrolase family 18 protein [Dactylosporangium aurantiacum]UWZ50465.1 carbohydrate binding domain-containing protein [Dactylosporangium aurantiacum]